MNEAQLLKKIQLESKELSAPIAEIRSEIDQVKREKSRWWIPLIWQFIVLNLLMWGALVLGVK